MKRSRRVKRDLPPAVALLGFCGAPWTVATYMIAGRGTPDQGPARLFAYRHPEAFAMLIDLLVEASASYLIRQFEAGVDAVQIFDTWAGVLRPASFANGASSPAARIVAAVRKQIPGARIIGFPRGAGTELRTLSRRGRGRCGRARLDGASSASRAIRCRRAGRCRAISTRWCCSPAAHALDRCDRCDPRGIGGRAVHLQSRPRHPAGNADRPCRAADRARAQGRGLSARARPGGRRTPCMRGSRRSTSSRSSPGWRGCSICRGCSSITARPRRLGPVGNLQGHGAPAAARHHQSGDDCGDRRLGSGSPGSGLILATAGSPQGGLGQDRARPRPFGGARLVRPLGQGISPPTATPTRKDSIGLSTRYRRC